jgi:dienelactone hydrolase
MTRARHLLLALACVGGALAAGAIISPISPARGVGQSGAPVQKQGEPGAANAALSPAAATPSPSTASRSAPSAAAQVAPASPAAAAPDPAPTTPPVAAGATEAAGPASGTAPQANQDAVVPAMPSRGLAVSGVSAPGRTPIRRDAIESRIVRGTLGTPTAGEPVRDDPSAPKWLPVEADAYGAFPIDAFRGGYLLLEVESANEQVAMLECSGHAMVYVNGAPRMGDPYASGTLAVPVQLLAGRNEFLFAGGRSPILPKLTPLPRSGVFLDTRDVTAPDLVTGEALDAWVGIPVVNAGDSTARGLAIDVSCGPGSVTRTAVPAVQPRALHKAAARIECAAATSGSAARITVSLRSADSAPGQGPAISEATLELPIKSAAAARRETFRSAIDGSAQYYAVVPPLPQPAADGAPARRPGMLLSLHGAGVDAASQAASYAPKPWAVVVAPTNRRPYGFDWEDWGRLDAMEVLALARTRHRTDPLKQWLTGHSMGGHGTWQVGAHRSGDFAALGPSAGWVSFFTYGGAKPASASLSPGASDAERAIASALDTAANPSRTLLLKDNYLTQGIYVLHGDADETVPVEESRDMRVQLGQYHRDFAYREKAGAGHWWGNQCVDWPAMMDFLRARELAPPESRTRIAFTTISPAIRSRDAWVTIDAQVSPLQPSSVDLSMNRDARTVTGKTSNVARLGLQVDLDGDGGTISLSIDGTELVADEPSGGELLWLERATRDDGSTAWTLGRKSSDRTKRAGRMGPFKAVFDRNMLFVVGTGGSEAQRAALARKVRYDAEQFLYRGNASPEIADDAAILADPSIAAGRNIILYGNAETNRAWSTVVGESPVTPVRGAIHFTDSTGRRGTLSGDDLALLMVRPRADDPECLVATISGTGEIGQRLTERVPYFTAGVAYPDMCVLSARMLDEGIPGIVAADFFANDWTLPRLPALAVTTPVSSAPSAP